MKKNDCYKADVVDFGRIYGDQTNRNLNSNFKHFAPADLLATTLSKFAPFFLFRERADGSRNMHYSQLLSSQIVVQKPKSKPRGSSPLSSCQAGSGLFV